MEVPEYLQRKIVTDGPLGFTTLDAVLREKQKRKTLTKFLRETRL